MQGSGACPAEEQAGWCWGGFSWGMDVEACPRFGLCPVGLWVHPSSVRCLQAAQELCVVPVLIQSCWLWHPLPWQGLTGHSGLGGSVLGLVLLRGAWLYLLIGLFADQTWQSPGSLIQFSLIAEPLPCCGN